MEKTIFIRKEAGKERKDVRRIFTKADLPELPSKDDKVKAIEIVDGKLVLDCAEGVEKAQFGDVIA